MKKLVNDPSLVVEDMIEGLLYADRRLTRIDGENVVLRRDYRALADEGKVALISGGGAGHEPAHAGFVGEGMLTAAVIGAVFTSPSVDAVLAAIKAVAGPAGVLLIVKNYTGDRLNFGLAAEIARADGIIVDMIIVGDDVALDNDGGRVGRRGIAGTVLVHKIAGAGAAAGLSLAEVKAEAQAACAGLFSMGLGLGSCIVPAAGKRGFELGPDEVEFGLGIHGESGARRGPIQAADAMLDELMERLIQRGGLHCAERVALLVNNLGATAVQELSIVARRALVRLNDVGIRCEAVIAGSLLTALEMPGVSISLLKLDDRRRERLFVASDAPAWIPPTIPADGLSAAPRQIGEEAAGGVADDAWSEENGARLSDAIARVSSALREAEPQLTELDSIVGDGDIGISLVRGTAALTELLPDLDVTHPAAALRQMSATLRRALGGTSGPLYAAFLVRAGTTLAQTGAATDPATWAAAFRAGCSAVQSLGGANAGDRTMLDALLPAADAIENTVREDKDIVAILNAAVSAAERGVEATKSMVPRLGRSSYVGGRALGHADPGAVAAAIWLRAIAASLE